MIQPASVLLSDHTAMSVGSNAATLKAPLSKTMAVDASIRNAERAVQILGAYGITDEYPTARMLNDAWIGYSCDFTREMLRLGMVPFLPVTE